MHQNLRWCQHFEMSPILKSMTMDSCTGEPSGFDMLMYNTSNKLSHFRKSKFVYTSVIITDNPQVLPRWIGFFFSLPLSKWIPLLYISHLLRTLDESIYTLYIVYLYSMVTNAQAQSGLCRCMTGRRLYRLDTVVLHV